MLDSLLITLEEKKEAAERRRDELLRALESGDVAEPVTGTLFTIAVLKGLLISAAVSVGTSLLTRALTPRQKFTTGQLQGTLQVPQSEQGLPIVEGYGAAPESKASAFQASHAYALEDRVVDGNYFYVVTTAGTSAGSAPTFPTAKGATVTSNTVTFTNYGRTGGGFRLPMLIVYASSIRKHATKTKVSGGGKGPKPAEQTEISYDLDLGIMPGRGPLRIKRIKANTDIIYQSFQTGPTGVPDPTVPPDDSYPPETPPTPNTPYERPSERFSGVLTPDGAGVLVGNIIGGGYAGVAIYPGNTDQLPDPTIQAAIDALYGADSTPAYWNRCLVVLTNFFLTKFGGAIPLISTLAEHETLDTLELIFDHFCERVGVLEVTDYDFSGLRRVFVRGFPVTPPYNPADVMEELARIYNVYFVEGDKVYARVRGSQPIVAALTSANIGWVDGDSDDEEQELPSLDWDIPTETEIARRYELTAVDPDRDFEQNSQGTSRQITSSEKTEKIELALTLYVDEMREVTQRELYEEEVQSTKHTLSLDWTYLWLQPGDSITVAEDDGTTSRIFVESIRPNVGVIPVEGSAEELAVYSQPVSTSGGGVFEVPPVPIPGMAIIGFYDEGALRTQEEGKSGHYIYFVKRTGDGDVNSAAIYKETPGDPQLITVLQKQATLGVFLTQLGAWEDTSVEDSTQTVTADAGADTLTHTAHELEDGETVTFSNSGGALPGGLSASVLYYVRDSAANTFRVALTSGGSAVDITSAGTGTHSVQRVADIDLYGTEATLETVTTDQIERGDNAFLFGNEVVQVRTWEQVAGFSNRWRGRNFTRGRVNTGLAIDDHVAGERVLLLDDAVQFIEQDIAALNVESTYRAVTSGQSYDDAAQIDFVWTGGALKFPAPSIQASKDSNGDWRFLIFGVETRDPAGERYKLEIDGSPRAPFILRGAAPRPVSLSTSSALPSDMVPPGSGKKHYRSASIPGNSLTNQGGQAIQMVRGERTSISFTYSSTLDETTVLTGLQNNASSVTFTPGMFYGLTMVIAAETSTTPASLTITGDASGVDFEDTDGEATGTRYTIEFIDGKVKFYRDRHLNGNPFYVLTLPSDEIEPLFPMEPQFSAGFNSTLSDIEIDDEGAAVVYYESEQVADFGSAQASLTVRACQQRVVGGVVVDGQVAELTFP
jgi:hypothetical protein